MGLRQTLAAGLSGLGSWLNYAADDRRHAVTRTVTDAQGMLLPHYRTFNGLVNAFSRVYSARWDEAIKRFPADAQSMRNDCYLMALFDERTIPLSRWKWQIDDDEDEAGASKEDPKREEVRAALEAVIRRTWRLHHLREYQREAVWYGRHAAQVARGVELVQGVPRQVIVRHVPVHGDKIFTDFDGFDAVAINAAAIGAAGTDFGDEVTYTDRMPVLRLRNPEWRQRFIVQKWRMRDGDYFDPYSAGQVGGVGLRHYVYWAWWLRDEMLSWATDFLEKVGSLGLMIFYYEEGNETSFLNAKQAATDASNQNAIAVPLPRGKDAKTAGLDLIPANVSGAQFLKEFIGDYFERHIERMIVGQTLSGSSEGSGLGGTGVARLHMDTKFQLLASDAECFDAGYTEDLVRPTLELNWPGCPYRFRWRHILPDPEAETRLAAAKTFTDMGGELEEDEVRETTGFRTPQPGAKTIGGPKPVPVAPGLPGASDAKPKDSAPNDDDKPAPAAD